MYGKLLFRVVFSMAIDASVYIQLPILNNYGQIEVLFFISSAG